MAIHKEHIFEVANRLDAEGKNPTLVAIRKEIGGGSYTTISDAMTEWRVAKAAQEVSVREPAPPALAQQVTSLGTEIWGAALDLANARLASERESLGTARAQLEAEKDEAAELADSLQVELEQEHVHAKEMKAQLDQLQHQLATTHTELAKQNERTIAAQARAEEIARRADDLNRELARVNAQNTELVRALANATQSKGKGPDNKA